MPPNNVGVKVAAFSRDTSSSRCCPILSAVPGSALPAASACAISSAGYSASMRPSSRACHTPRMAEKNVVISATAIVSIAATPHSFPSKYSKRATGFAKIV